MRRSKLIAALTAEQGLVVVGPEALTLRRVRYGTGFGFRTATGAVLRDAKEVARLRSLAMPPAYVDVRYATHPAAHLQAVGTDAAGRFQYRYHPKWTEVREALKAQRLGRLARALPTIRRAVSKALASENDDAAHAIAAIVHLVSLTAIRAGSESYARDNGTRGASTLLKSNVKIDGNTVMLSFKAKGGKAVFKEVRDARLARALTRLLALPGRQRTRAALAAQDRHDQRRRGTRQHAGHRAQELCTQRHRGSVRGRQARAPAQGPALEPTQSRYAGKTGGATRGVVASMRRVG